MSTKERLSFRQLAAQSQQERWVDEADTPNHETQFQGVGAESRNALYQELCDYLAVVLEAVRQNNAFSLEPGIDLLEKVAHIQKPLDALFLKAIHTDDSHNFVVNHSVNLAIYSMKMAEKLGFSKNRQVEIGMLGLFHDIGTVLISDDIVYKKERLSENEFEQLKERPRFGHEILKRFEDEYPFLAEGALQVYEKIDGSGYPKGLIGEEIHEYAQIVGLVDVYEALIHTRPQRQRLPHFFAVKEIIRTGKGKYQRKYLKALLNTFSIFPMLSYVRLNSGAIGQVVKTYANQPMRPKVRVIYDSQKQRVLTERLINLPENPLLYITDSISEEELLAVSENSDLVDSKAEDAEIHTPASQNSKTRPGKIDRKGRKKGRWPFSRMGWAPVCIIVAGAVAAVLLFNSDRSITASPTPMEKADAANHEHRPEKPLKKAAGNLPEDFQDAVSDKSMAKGVGKAGVASASLAIEGPESNDSVPLRSTFSSEGESHGSSLREEGAPDSEIPKIDVSISTPPAAPAESGNNDSVQWEAAFPYSIKFGSHKRKPDAVKAVELLKASGIPAHWVKVDLGDDGIWYRVFSGYFETDDAARAYIRKKSLRDVRVKRTRFSTLAGSFTNRDLAENRISEIGEKGIGAYLLERNKVFHVFVGAFYTAEGADAQHADLFALGVPNRIVTR